MHLKDIVDVAVSQCVHVKTVFAFQYTGRPNQHMHPTRDVWMHTLLPSVRPYCPCEPMDSEDTLFILYTSGGSES